MDSVFIILIASLILSGLAVFHYIADDISGWTASIGCAPLIVMIVGGMIYILTYT